MKISFNPIGVIHTQFKEKTGVPIQPRFSSSGGTVEIAPEYAEGLRDLEDFSYIILIFCFHESKGYSLTVKPFLDEKERGVFATRAPNRPNMIGVSVVKLEKVEKNILHVSGVDMLDNTPILDIKPYVRDFDSFGDAKQGWLEGRIRGGHKSDNRFG